ncbi:MAG: 16S rRNA (cytosine(1402)-N(4))-methyltransferase RsmH [Elusimicrobiota bacterium]|nr:16S rRNA (cytosine(1402)-N(4))-methyltransferase RsmH [Elusimicrobiota bacterium]
MILEERRYTHESVLLAETLERLVTDKGGLYLDATLGLGGHSEALLNKLSAQGKVLGLDADPEALAEAGHRLGAHSGRFHAVRSNFRSLGAVLEQEGFFPLTGALFDLGVSSLQLDKPSRGFSFQREGPLDMRLGPDSGLTAEQIVNRWPAEQIAMLLTEFGEEPEADKISRAIVARRAIKPLTTTLELADCVESVVPRTGHHPATRTFQALRIAVNQELESLTRGLEAVMPYLKNGGRLCVITFHSLEDRIVKNVFASFVAQGSCAYVGKGDAKSAVAPSEEEIARNPRSRSAKLRVIEKKR